MLLHNVNPGLFTTLFAVLGCCCKEVQSQMGLLCGPRFVHLWTMLAMLCYPSTGAPFCYHTSNAEVILSYWSFSGLECLQVKTRWTVPFLIDMKIFYALLKMSFGASYAPWHVDQFLLGHPLLYGVWHPYKYSVEITYKAFAPVIKFLEQGWDLKAGAVVPMKVKLGHMEKTVVGLFLAKAANKARNDSTTQVLMSNLAELSDAQRLGLKCLLALKARLYSYCPALLALGVVCECNLKGRSLHSSAAAKDCIGMSTI